MFFRERVEKVYAPLYDGPGLGTTIWSPLQSGLLTGKYNSGKAPADSRIMLENYKWLTDRVMGDESKLEKVRKLTALAEEIGTSMPLMAIAWCLKNPNVSTVILGASRVEQLEENLKAVDVVDKLTPEVMAKIEAILGNAPS